MGPPTIVSCESTAGGESDWLCVYSGRLRSFLRAPSIHGIFSALTSFEGVRSHHLATSINIDGLRVHYKCPVRINQECDAGVVRFSRREFGIQYSLAQNLFPPMPPPILCQTVGFLDSNGIAVKDTEVTMVPRLDGLSVWYAGFRQNASRRADCFPSGHLTHKYQVPHQAFVQGSLRNLSRIKDLPWGGLSGYRINVATRSCSTR